MSDDDDESEDEISGGKRKYNFESINLIIKKLF